MGHGQGRTAHGLPATSQPVFDEPDELLGGVDVVVVVVVELDPMVHVTIVPPALVNFTVPVAEPPTVICKRVICVTFGG